MNRQQQVAHIAELMETGHPQLEIFCTALGYANGRVSVARALLIQAQEYRVRVFDCAA